MNDTLPLFDAVELGTGSSGTDPGRCARSGKAAGKQLPSSGVDPTVQHPESAAGSTAERHLRAAWRLSRGMGRYPEGSPAQTRSGLAICHHLQALLAEAGR